MTFIDIAFRLDHRQRYIAWLKKDARRKYGSKSSWPDFVLEKMERAKDDCRRLQEMLRP